MASISMSVESYEDNHDVQDLYSKELAQNASQIHYYDEQLEKVRRLPNTTRKDIDHIIEMIDRLYEEREQLSEKYMKALRKIK